MIGERPRRGLTHRANATFALRPRLEQLEGRFLLYATTGMQWPKPKLITYSIVPDGTSIGGVPSNLQQTLNARFATADWQAQFSKAASAWQKMANINFTRVADSGAPLGVSGNMQSDSRFGDIRIGGYAMTGNILAFAFLPPPANGGTSAGDIFFNTSMSWQLNATTYDLMTVAIHEFGHALGMNHSALSAAEMWPSYTGAEQVLSTDDTAGIRTIYNSRQNDFFDANGANDAAGQADNISSYIESNLQLAISALDSTTPIMIGSNDTDWFKITVPATTTGTMVVRMQSTNLSLLAPWLAVYNSAGTTILGQASSTAWGDTVTVTINGVSAGQVYDIRCKGATSGDSGFGSYGLQVNFGSQTQPPVSAPNTTMAEQADQGGGTLAESSDGSDTGDGTPQDNSAIPGVPTFWVYEDDQSVVNEETGEEVGPAVGDESDSEPVPDSTLPVDGEQIIFGDESGVGHALMINAADEASLDNRTFEGPLPWTPVLLLRPAITMPTPSFRLDPDIRGLIAPLDFDFALYTGNALMSANKDVSSRPVDDTRPGLERNSDVDSQFVADRTPTDCSLLYSNGDDRAPVDDPSLIDAKDRDVESMPFGCIDELFDGWGPDSPD